MSVKFRGKYEYENVFGHARHTWSVVLAAGAMHLHVVDGGERAGEHRYSGGIEVHYRQPPRYMRDEPPSHDHCWLLQSPCWHDGSSLQASERWIPLWLAMPHEHDTILRMLAEHAEMTFFGAREDDE